MANFTSRTEVCLGVSKDAMTCARSVRAERDQLTIRFAFNVDTGRVRSPESTRPSYVAYTIKRRNFEKAITKLPNTFKTKTSLISKFKTLVIHEFFFVRN